MSVPKSTLPTEVFTPPLSINVPELSNVTFIVEGKNKHQKHIFDTN
jgi:hypothetical protein